MGQWLVGTPIRIIDCHPQGFLEVVRVPSLDYGLQRHAHVETIFGELHAVLVIHHLVLVARR